MKVENKSTVQTNNTALLGEIQEQVSPTTESYQKLESGSPFPAFRTSQLTFTASPDCALLG